MKTTLGKILSEIILNDNKLKTTPAWGDLASEFKLWDLHWSDDQRLKCYFISVECQTDTWVGTKAYFLDHEFVAISYQESRKSFEDFDFFSKERAMKVKQYLESLLESENVIENLTYISQDDFLLEEIEDTYRIEYSSHIIHKSAIYTHETQGELNVKIIKTYNDMKHLHEVIIELPNGEQKEVDCRDLKFKYNSI
jgi:hypothetical protein